MKPNRGIIELQKKKKRVGKVLSPEQIGLGKVIVVASITFCVLYTGFVYVITFSNLVYLALILAALLYSGQRLARYTIGLNLILAPLVEYLLLKDSNELDFIVLSIGVVLGVFSFLGGIILLSSRAVSVFLVYQRKKLAKSWTVSKTDDVRNSFFARLRGLYRRLFRFLWGGKD